VTANLNISNLQEMRDACTRQTAMMSKMASINRRIQDDEDYARAMNMPDIVQYIHDHPETEITVEEVGGQYSLVFETPATRRFKILKLLDDDYLRSPLTDWYYETNSKTPTAR